MIADLCMFEYSNSLVITFCIFTFKTLSEISYVSCYVCITSSDKCLWYWGYFNRWNFMKNCNRLRQVLQLPNSYHSIFYFVYELCYLLYFEIIIVVGCKAYTSNV